MSSAARIQSLELRLSSHFILDLDHIYLMIIADFNVSKAGDKE